MKTADDFKKALDIRKIIREILPELEYTASYPDARTVSGEIVKRMEADTIYSYAGESPIYIDGADVCVGNGDMEDFALGCELVFSKTNDTYFDDMVGIEVAGMMRKMGGVIASTVAL